MPSDDKPAAPTVPQKRHRSQMELQDKYILGALGTMILAFLGMLNSQYNFIDMTNLVLVNNASISANDGYLYRRGDENLRAALSVIVTVLASCGITMFFIGILHRKPKMKRPLKILMALIPLTAILLSFSYNASVSEVLESRMTMNTWAKERYNITIPQQNSSTAVDGALFRNSENNEILEFKENNGRLFIHYANGAELPHTISDNQAKG